ncbi:hypothetical protein AGMMS50225_06160 [Betaproteobacteria bacterium]|nr:hypothetical protein AGMMS50225_06160 [Betaproteobacteria bacterium]
MSTVTFDTLQFVRTLEAQGFNSNVAEICTKQDLHTALAEAKMEIIKWNVGIIMAAVGLTITIVKLIG